VFGPKFTINQRSWLYSAVMRSRYSEYVARNAALLKRLVRAGHIIKVQWTGILNGIPTVHDNYYFDTGRYVRLTANKIDKMIYDDLTSEEKIYQEVVANKQTGHRHR
jgi:hypothetical protein